jgi:DNA polymerase III delta subunit
MKQYESLLNGIRMNNLLINAIIRKVGLSAEEVKDECDKLSLELEEEAKRAEAALNEEQSSDAASKNLSMGGGEGDHPEEATIFGD